MTLHLLLALLFTVAPARAHRLDEYLQATLMSVEKDRVEAQVRLTPGVSVLPLILSEIDTDRDGVISDAERRAYERTILAGLLLTVDGNPQQLQLRAASWPPLEEMKEGRGEIRLDLSAAIASRTGTRHLVFENHNQPAISAYLVNCLAPSQPDITITAQKRNYEQSSYRLDYLQSGTLYGGVSGTEAAAGIAMLLLLTRLAWHWRSARPLKS